MARKLELDSVSAGVNLGFANLQGTWKAKEAIAEGRLEVRRLRENRRLLMKEYIRAKMADDSGRKKELWGKIKTLDEKVEELAERELRRE